MKANEFIAYVVFDLETGGLNDMKNAIVEAAFIPVLPDKSGELIIDKELSFDCLIKPYSNYTIESKALQVNGLSLKEINKNGLDSKDVVDAIIELSDTMISRFPNVRKDRNMKPILVGHNIDNFDIGFLVNLFAFHKKNLFDYFNKSTIDTYTDARRFFRKSNVENFRLETLCNYVGVRIVQAHRAYDDALGNAGLFIKMEKALANVKRKNLIEL